MYKVKASEVVTHLILMYLGSPRLGHKNKLYQNSDCCSSDILNFDFLKKSLGLVFPTHFVHYVSFLTLNSINWPNLTALLHLLLEISGNICITIVCYPVDDVITFKIYLQSWTKPYVTPKNLLLHFHFPTFPSIPCCRV